MKKKYVISLLFIGFYHTVIQAQDISNSQSKEQRIKLTGGITVESNYSNFIHSGINNGNSKMKPGAGLGGFLNMGISKSFSIQGEMTFQYKSSDFTVGSQTGNYQYWGMEVPIYAFYHFNFNRGNRLYIGIGPYTTFGLGASFRQDGKKTDVYEKDKEKGLPIMKDSDTGFGVKVGYEFASGLQINASYKASVTNIMDANSSDVKMYPQYVSLGIAYRFGK